MLIGVTITSAGFLLLSYIDALWNFYAVLTLISLGYGFGFFIPMATAVANWFDRKIGKAMGLFQAGYAGCGLIPPILVLLINQYGWRTTLVLVGLGLWVVCVPLTLLVRHRPEPYGYLPDGEKLEKAGLQREVGSSGGQTASGSASREAKEFSLGESLREPSFWLITAAVGMAGFAYSALLIHEIPYLISLGISAEVAALGMTCLTLSSFLGRVGFGWLGDMFAKRYVMAACFAIQLIGVLVLAMVSAVWLVFLALAIFGPGYGGAMPLRVAMQRDYFGRRSYGLIQGTMLLFMALPSALGPIFAGWVFDVNQSYQPAFLVKCQAAGPRPRPSPLGPRPRHEAWCAPQR